MGREIVTYWCDACQTGIGKSVVGTHYNSDMYQLSVNHTGVKGCTIKNYLDEYFHPMDSDVDFSTGTYSHQCKNIRPRQRIHLMDTFGEMEKVLILQLNPWYYSWSA